MPKGVRKERIYTGKAAKLDEKVKSLEAALKEAKAERDLAYKEQLKEERKAKKEQNSKLEKELLKTAVLPFEVHERFLMQTDHPLYYAQNILSWQQLPAQTFRHYVLGPSMLRSLLLVACSLLQVFLAPNVLLYLRALDNGTR